MSVFKRLDFWLIVGFVLVFFLILPFVPISDGDTFYYISKARRILNTGDLFNLNTLTTKPVLGMWAMALSLKIWGYNLFGVYFWHTLFSAGILGLLYVFCQKQFDKKTALYAVGILLTALMFFYQTASPMLDMPMLFFLLLGQTLAFKYLKSWRSRYLYALGLAAGLGFLTKGLLPAALPFMTGAIYLLWTRPKINFIKLIWQLILCFCIGAIVCSIWLIPQYKTYGADFSRALFSENIERFFHPIDETGGYREVSSDRQIDPHLNLLYLWLGFLPWSPLIIPAIHSAYKNKFWRKQPEIIFLLCWFFLVLILTSVSGHYKGPRYLLPLFAPLAVLCGIFLAKNKLKNYPRLICWSYWLTGLVFALLALVLPFIKYTHGEEVYRPVVLPFLIYFTICLFGSGWVFRKKNSPDFTIYSVLISYIILFVCGAVFLPGLQFPEKYIDPHSHILRLR